MTEPRRVASPVNRTESFEIAITTSPPLSPYPEDDSETPSKATTIQIKSPFSPRRNVHETIMRELRETTTIRTFHPQTRPPAAPIAQQESTSTLNLVVEEQAQKEQNLEEGMEEKEVQPNEDVQSQADDTDNKLQEETSNDQQETDERNDNQQTNRPIVFPITPFYGAKSGCSKFSWCVASLCALFLLLSIALFIAWAVTTDGFRSIGSKTKNVCNSRECIDMSFRLSSNIDEAIDSCNNFYRHSCQRYHSQTTDQQLNFLSQLKEKSLRQLHGLLSSEVEKNNNKTTKIARSLYDSCMNAVQRSINAPQDIQEFLSNFPCGPILRGCDHFNADSYSWFRHSGMLDWYAGTFNFIVLGRDVHPEDRSKVILQIKPPNLSEITDPIIRDLINLAQPSSSEFEALLQLSLRQNFLTTYVRDELRQDPRNMESDLDDVAQLIVNLHRATRKFPIVQSNTTYMTMGELFQALPRLYFKEFLNSQLSNIYKWTNEDVISILDFDYFARLTDIIATTSRKTVANYLVIMTSFHLKKYSYSTKEQFGWHDCVEQISRLDISSKMMIDDRASVDLNQIRQFLNTLKIDFLSTHRSTPLQYLSTINRLGFYVGYPSKLTREETVLMPLSQVNLNSSDYFSSYIQLAKAERDFAMSQIGTYLDGDDTTEFPINDPTMLYNPNVESIVIPLTFLEQPINFPGEDVPMYSVYSSLGLTVLQMISKIFWNGLDRTSQLQCFDNLFREFLDVNNQRSPNIDIQLYSTIELSDAFKTAVYSYTKWQSDHNIHREKTLPAFDSIDSVKAMMLSFSTLFCSSEGVEPGSDYEAMINTVVSNSRMFSIHFNCNNSTRLFNRRSCI